TAAVPGCGDPGERRCRPVHRARPGTRIEQRTDRIAVQPCGELDEAFCDGGVERDPAPPARLRCTAVARMQPQDARGDVECDIILREDIDAEDSAHLP